MKYSIRQNSYDNWYGYAGNKKVKSFFADAERTQEQNAQKWLDEVRLTAVSNHVVKNASTPPGLVRFQVFLTPEQKEFLRRYTYENRIPGSEVIRDCINAFARKHGEDLTKATTK